MGDIAAVTSVTISGRSVFGNKRITWGVIVLGDGIGSTMPAAGLAVTKAQLGFGQIDAITFSNKTLPYSWASDLLYSGAGAAVPADASNVYWFAIGPKQEG